MAYTTTEIEKVFPIAAVENDCIISKCGDVTVVYEIKLPEIYTLHATPVGDNETGDYQELIQTWTKAIGILVPGTILHKQDWFVEETYKANSKQVEDTYLDRSSEAHFNERPYLHHSCYVYLTYCASDRVKTSFGTTALLTGQLVPKKALNKSEIEKFLVAVQQFSTILSSTKLIKCRRLKNDEIQPGPEAPIGTVGLIERYMTLSLREDVVPLMDMDFTFEDELRIGGKYSKFFTVSDVDQLPSSVNPSKEDEKLSDKSNSYMPIGLAAPIGLGLNCNHIYNQYVIVEDKTTIIADLEKKAGNMQSLSGFDRLNKVNAELVKQFLTYAHTHSQVPVRIHYNLQIWTEKKERLPQIRNEASSNITLMNLKPRENTRDAAFYFFAAIPGNAADLPREETFIQFAPQAVCLFNHETNYFSSNPPKDSLRVVDRISGYPLWVDFSEEPMKQTWVSNRNKIIIGPSGTGKSFLTNSALRSYHLHGAHIVLVDIGDSYKGLCAMLGGKYITYSMEKPIQFNPFYIEGRGKLDTEKAEALKNLLTTLWKTADEKVNRSEYTALSAAVIGYFAKLDQNPQIFPCFDTFFEFMQVDFKAYLQQEGVKDEFFDYDNFMFNLKPYYKGGPYDFLLNSTENLDLLNERFIVFEMDNVKDHPILYPVVTIIIIDTFISKMRKLAKSVRKIMAFEEAWKAILSPKMAEYLKYIYKTVRKFDGEAWVITQEIKDILDNPIVKDTIVKMSDTKILLDHSQYLQQIEQLRSLIGLTLKEKDLLISVGRDLKLGRRYREFFVSWGGKRSRVYGLEVSRPEYYAYTTDSKEKERVLEKVNRHRGNWELALAEIVQEEEFVREEAN